MELTVIRDLNIRIGRPSLSAPANRSVTAGGSVDVRSVTVGDAIDGNSLWYVSADQLSYYWSGGFKETNFQLDRTSLEDFTPQQQFAILMQLKNEAAGLLGNTVSGYLACGIGRKNYDDRLSLSLIVYVAKKEHPSALKEMVVKNIFYRGIMILSDVVEMDAPAHHYIPRSEEFLNNVPGSSPTRIGEGIRTSHALGTLSVRVFKKNSAGQDEPYALSCYHVLCGSLLEEDPPVKSSSGGSDQPTFFPVMKDVGEVQRPVATGSYGPDFDFAAVRLESEFDLLNKMNDTDITDFYHFDDMHQLPNQVTVRTIGKRSFEQTGRVLSISDITLPPISIHFSNVIFCEQISVRGDSGAPVIDAANGKLIGFVIGGDERTVSYIIPFYNIYALGYHLNSTT